MFDRQFPLKSIVDNFFAEEFGEYNIANFIKIKSVFAELWQKA